MPAGSVLEVPIAGRGGVAVNADSAVLNVTVVGAKADGYLTVWPCGSAQPNASNLNYGGGQTIPNAVVSKLGTGGKVCIYAYAATDLLVDVNGAFAPVAAALMQAPPPVRLPSIGGEAPAEPEAAPQPAPLPA